MNTAEDRCQIQLGEPKPHQAEKWVRDIMNESRKPFFDDCQKAMQELRRKHSMSPADVAWFAEYVLYEYAVKTDQRLTIRWKLKN
jgi:hypothetical protein